MKNPILAVVMFAVFCGLVATDVHLLSVADKLAALAGLTCGAVFALGVILGRWWAK